MRSNTTKVMASVIVLCAAVLVTSQETPMPRTIDHDAHLKEVAAQLDPINQMRLAIESGDKGDGVYYQWMDRMKAYGVKHANFTVRFIWTRKVRSVERN